MKTLWDWDEVEMAVLCPALFSYIIDPHTACRGAAHCGTEILIQMNQAAWQYKHNTYT